ncbi:MAG: hypothetical protein KGN76_14175 [Acidobacteriota bacterium]|nr:hypothetical protein [Acidobacteriota bacterium]
MTRSIVASGPEPLVHRNRGDVVSPRVENRPTVACSDALDVVCLAVVITLIGATLLFVF